MATTTSQQNIVNFPLQPYISQLYETLILNTLIFILPKQPYKKGLIVASEIDIKYHMLRANKLQFRMCLTIWFCHKKSLSVALSLCPSHQRCVCHWFCISVTDNPCCSQTVCVCQKLYVCVKDISVCLPPTWS